MASRSLGRRESHGSRMAHHAACQRGPRRSCPGDLASRVMSRQHWFLPETPDLLGLLRRQVAVTITSLDAFTAWAAGEEQAADAVRDAGPEGDAARRELMSALRAAFVAPLEP